jgi:hypothetical protein
MKAIVNVNKNSEYAKYNGNTFEVKDVLSQRIGLIIDGTITDFGYIEVIIVDIKKEIQIEYDKHNWGSLNCYLNLKSYCDLNKIDIYTEYNCPA